MKLLQKILGLAIVILGMPFIANGQSVAKAKDIVVNSSRLEKHIIDYGQFGKDANGKTYCVAFSKADQEGRAYYIGLMKKAGLSVSIDFAGNIIGKRNGKDNTKKPIAFGSHLDMVPAGGNYDGRVGSFGALEVIETLNENKIITEHPLQLMIFSDEEGGTVGSSALAGSMKKEALKVVSQSGLTIGEGIKAIGGNPDSLDKVILKRGSLACFLELHIEQGGILEKENLQIGVVEGIVGIEHWEVVVEGFANHAGTTPMNERHDALLAASKLIIAVNEVVNSYEGRQVGTVGKISAEPGAPNVIPGRVVFTLELRDLSETKIAQLFKDIQTRADAIAKNSGVKINITNMNVSSKPALTDPKIQSQITASVKKLGLTYKTMQSGAGHDAQEMAVIAPTGMIFIPSIGGISHSPKEFSKPSDIANGANVLLQTILAIDKE